MKRCVVTSNRIENAAANDALANWCTPPISTKLPASVLENAARLAWFLDSGKSGNVGSAALPTGIGRDVTGELDGG